MIGYLTPTLLHDRPPFTVRLGPALTIARIKREVATFYGVDVRGMDSARHSRDVARPRQIAMYLTRDLTPHSYPNIGKHFGKRDHTTVMHACKKVAELMQDSDAIAAQVQFLRERLAG